MKELSDSFVQVTLNVTKRFVNARRSNDIFALTIWNWLHFLARSSTQSPVKLVLLVSTALEVCENIKIAYIALHGSFVRSAYNLEW